MSDTGTQEVDRPLQLQCVAPDLAASIPSLQGDGVLRWRLVQLSSEVLDETWALVILPTEGRQAYAAAESNGLFKQESRPDFVHSLSQAQDWWE